tara:strand:+ start:893 stop:1135 length:243 start_codon:yes stop_codon:yes gene_type:complete
MEGYTDIVKKLLGIKRTVEDLEQGLSTLGKVFNLARVDSRDDAGQLIERLERENSAFSEALKKYLLSLQETANEMKSKHT